MTSLGAKYSWVADGIFPLEWDQLAQRNPYATVFQTSSWYRAWVMHVAAAEGAQPLLLRVPASGPLRAGVALQHCLLGEKEALRPLSWPWADYHDAVGDPADPEALAALVRGLREIASDMAIPLVLDEVVPGGLLDSSLQAMVPVETASVTEAIDLTDDVHMALVLGHAEHRMKLRRMKRLGAVEIRHLSQVDEVLARMPAFIDLHRRQWHGRPDAVAPFDGAVIDSAFLGMVRHLAPAGHLLLTELCLNGQPIAMYFGFVYRHWYGGYRTTYDLRYRRLSPGHLMLQRMAADFAAAGLSELDLMRGAYTYKRDYCNRVRSNRRLELGPG